VAFWQNVFEPQIDARVAIRVDGDPRTALASIRRALTAVDPHVPVTETITTDEQRRAQYTEVRLGGAVLTASACIALFLTAVGLFGVVSSLVAHRTKEIGIRLAVGTRPGEVIRLFVRQGLRPVWVGIAIGVAVSLWLAPLLSRWLFAIAPFDVATIAVAMLSVFSVAVLAIWIPARGAAKTDPAVVLRVD